MTLYYRIGCRKPSAEFTERQPGLVSARGAARPRQADVSRRARPGVRLTAAAPQVMADPPLALGDAEAG